MNLTFSAALLLAGALIPLSLSAENLDAAFQAAHAKVKSGTAGPVSPAARSARYLFAPSFLSAHLYEFGYFAAERERFAALGLDARIIDINTDSDGAGNRGRIQAAVEAACRDRVLAVLIGHSRGGMELHDWFRQASPDHKGCVAKVVLMQAPLQGTPLADATLANWDRPELQQGLGFILGEAWKSEAFRERVRQGYGEFSVAQRTQVMANLPMLDDRDKAKLLVFYTSYGPDGAGKVSPWHGDYMESQRAIIQAVTGQISDGSVPADSAKLAGVGTIFIADMDHMNPWIQNPTGKALALKVGPHPDYHGGDLIEALLFLLF